MRLMHISECPMTFVYQRKTLREKNKAEKSNLKINYSSAYLITISSKLLRRIFFVIS